MSLIRCSLPSSRYTKKNTWWVARCCAKDVLIPVGIGCCAEDAMILVGIGCYAKDAMIPVGSGCWVLC